MSTAAIQALSGWPAMPTPKTRSAPKEFTGDPDDLQDFLADYEISATGAQLTDEQKCRFLLKYVDRQTKYLIEVLGGYKNNDWAALKKELLGFYGSRSTSRRYHLNDLRSVVKTYSKAPIRNESQLQAYIRDYCRIAMWLKEKGRITEEDYNRRFWFGFHPSTRDRLIVQIHSKSPTLKRDKPYTFSIVKEAAEFLFSDTAFDAESSESSASDSDEESSDDSEDEEEEKHQKKSKKKRDREKEKEKEKKKKGRSKSKVPDLTSKKKKSSALVDANDVDDLIQRMSQLKIDDPSYAVVYMQFVTKYPAFAHLMQAPQLHQTSTPSLNNQSPVTPNPSKSSPPPRSFITRCFYCEEEGHGTRTCPYAEAAISQGLIIRSPEGFLMYPNGGRIPQNRGEGGMRAAVKAKAATIVTKSSGPVDHQSLLIEIESTPSLERSSFVEEEEEFGYEVYDVDRADRSKDTRDSPYPKKKPDTRRPRFDGVELPSIRKRDDKRPIPTAPSAEELSRLAKSSLPQDEEMVDAPPAPSSKKSPQYQYRSGIQDLATPEQIVDKTLALPVTITVGQLLANSLPVKRALEDKLKTHRIAVDSSKAPISTLPQASVNHVDGAELALASPLARIKGYCNDVETEFTMDQGSEINLITKECLNRIMPPINTGLRAVMRDANGGTREMEGVCEAMKITIGGMVSHANIHIGPESANYQILLGRPWFRYVRSKWEDRDDGLWISFTDPENPRRVIQVHAVPVPNQIPRSSFYTSLATFATSSTRLPVVRPSIPRPLMAQVQVSNTRAAVKWLKSQQALLVKAKRTYKPVAQRVRPVATTLPSSARVIRQFPEDPLLTLPSVPTQPPPFTPTERLTLERVQNLGLDKDGFLNQEEINLLLSVLKTNEHAIAFCEAEKGRFRDDYFSPYVIPVVEHIPWQEKNIPIAPSIKNDVIKLIKDKIATGVYERSQASYRSRWFCVAKKEKGKFRIVHDLQPLNAVTIRDAGLPPVMDEFVEPFAARACYSLFDIFVGYDHRALAEESRDMTSFSTPLGLLRLTTLPMGATNSVPEFQACVVFILQDEIPDTASPFIDDIAIRGPSTRYELPDGTFETIPDNPNIRRFVFEHLVDLNRILHRLGHAGATINGRKSFFCVPQVTIVGHTCNYEGRIPEASKVSKILNWPPCQNLTEVRGFLGTCGGVRIWIPFYSEIAKPLTDLTRKNVIFMWEEPQQWSMDVLKQRVSEAPALVPINYDSPNLIIVAVDSSPRAVGFVLIQLDDQGRRRPARYGSIAFQRPVTNYPQAKLELYGLYRALRKLRPYICNVPNLQVEVDAKYIKGMLNAPDEVPDSALNRWIYGILLYDFKLVHVPAAQHTVADSLSRRPPAPEDSEEEDDDEVFDMQFEMGLMGCQDDDENSNHEWDVFNVGVIPGPSSTPKEQDLSEGPSTDQTLEDIYRFLTTFALPDYVKDERTRRWFTKRTSYYFVANDRLYRRRQNGLHQLVVFPPQRQSILSQSHDSLGHKGVFATTQLMMKRFWWPTMTKDIIAYIKSCHECQIRSTKHHHLPITSYLPFKPWSRVFIDTMLMPKSRGFRYIIHARCDLTGYPEARMLRRNNAHEVGRFIMEEIITRHGCIEELISDNGAEYVSACSRMESRFNIPHIRISPYNSQANGVIERGHRTFREALLRLCGPKVLDWPLHFHSTLFAERVTIRPSTGYSPFYLEHGREPILPLDLHDATYLVQGMDKKMTTEELLSLRARQIARLEEDVDRARQKLMDNRIASKAQWERRFKNTIVPGHYEPGMLVLVRNTAVEKELDRKVKPRYLGPYVVIRKTKGGSYILSELDGSVSKLRYAAFRLLPYIARAGVRINLKDLLKKQHQWTVAMDSSSGEDDSDAPDNEEVDSSAEEEDYDDFYVDHNMDLGVSDDDGEC